MKKTVSLLLCAAMFCSLALFAGCNDDVLIQGDFSKKATDAEVQALLATVQENSNSWFGDTEAEDWDYGINYTADSEMIMRTESEDEMFETQSRMHAALAVSYLTYDFSGEVEVYTGVTQGLGDQAATAESEIKGEIYVLDGTMYLNGSARENDQEISGKYIYQSNNISSVASMIDPFLTLGDISYDLEQLIRNEHVTVYIDDSENEVKVKLSFNMQAFYEEYLDIFSAEDASQKILDSLQFERFEFYFSYLADTGLLTGYGTVAGATFPEKTITIGGDTGKLYIKFSYSEWFMKGDVEVNGPSDPESYKPVSEAV